MANYVAVPYVQEIAKEGIAKVPERYVRPNHDRPLILSSSSSSDHHGDPSLTQVPVIDMSKLLSQNLKESELEKLHHACKDWGFFQLVNHGVSDALLEKVKRGTKEFYDLPMEEKKKFRQREGDVEGYGQLFVVSEEQKLEWGDVFFMITSPPHLRKPHLFPNFPLPFRDDLETYYGELKNLSLQIVELMANALKMDPREMRDSFGETTQATRINYYPPCPQPELVMGLNTHSDGSGLTILLQLNQVEGLQIMKDGQYVPVKPLHNAFIVNVGDILEMITNGIYTSIEHRVTVNSEKERLSLATFLIPSMESIIGPAPSLITPQSPPLFKTLTYAEYYMRYLTKELRGKEFLYSMKIQNQSED